MSDTTKVILVVAVLGLAFQLGRVYEHNEARKHIEAMGKEVMDAEYIIPDNLPYAGEIAVGNCSPVGESWTQLFRYGGFIK